MLSSLLPPDIRLHEIENYGRKKTKASKKKIETKIYSKQKYVACHVLSISSKKTSFNGLIL